MAKNVLGQSMPRLVHVAGDEYTWKETEKSEGTRCEYCGAVRGKHRPVFSYETSGESFCNVNHFKAWLFKGRQSNYRRRKVQAAAKQLKAEREVAAAETAKSAPKPRASRPRKASPLRLVAEAS